MISVSMDAIFRMAEQVKGFLDPEEGQRLYDVAYQASPLGPCLEIGSYCGKSALFLGWACKARQGTLFSIDHHNGSEEQQPGEQYFDPELFSPGLYAVDTFPHFRRTLHMAGLEDTVVPVVAESAVAARAWQTPLSLVFIDGGHAFETVLKDFQSWSPHILTGGYLMIHDIFPNPADGGQAPYQVYQAAVRSGYFEARPTTGTLGVLKKVRKTL